MDITYLDFFTSMCAPVLEDLTLGPPFSLITLPKLKALQLTYETLPVPISSDALTSLALTGGAEQWDLQRDDIHFPLETLSLRVTPGSHCRNCGTEARILRIWYRLDGS